MASFVIPKVDFNASKWGPTSVSESLAGLPFSAFSKKDKLGKAADISGRRPWQRGRRRGDIEEAEIVYKHDAKEAAQYTVVDTAKLPKRNDWRRARKNNRNRTVGTRGWEDKGPVKRVPQSGFNKRYDRLNRARWAGRRRNDNPRIHREPSVTIMPEWKVLEQADLLTLSKTTVSKVPEPEDLKFCGPLHEFDLSYDRVTAARPRPLPKFKDRQFFFISTTFDPIIGALDAKGGNVFATEAVLSHLMAAPRTEYPWDLVFTYFDNGKIAIDVRDAFEFEKLTVSETSVTQPPEDDPAAADGRFMLSLEATGINQNFSHAVLKSPTPKPPRSLPVCADHPYWEAEEAGEYEHPEAYTYRYRRWKVSPEIDLVARTTLHGYTNIDGRCKLTTVYTLNEWDPATMGVASSDWRKNIDSKRGTILANEIKNNRSKIAKWTAQSMLAGADEMRIGFVSRSSKGDTENHDVLGMHVAKPLDFAHQASMAGENMWGIFKWAIDTVRKHARAAEGSDEDDFEAKFVLLRDPNAPRLTLYSVPLDAFDDDETSSEESSDDEPAGGGGGGGGGGGAKE